MNFILILLPLLSAQTILFSLPNDVITNPKILKDAVSGEKIKDRELAISWLAPDLIDNPQNGDVLKWSSATNGFYFDQDNTYIGSGGGVTSLTIGAGFLGQGNTVKGDVVLQADMGTQKLGNRSIVPYFNTFNKVVLENNAKLLLSSPTKKFTLGNNGDFVIKGEQDNQNYLVIKSTGSSFALGPVEVQGQSVCLQDGFGCPVPIGHIKSISTLKPLTGGGSAGIVNIFADWGTNPGQLIRLEATGSSTVGNLPSVDGSQLSGVLKKINEGTAISISDFLGNTTINLRMGASGLAQTFQPLLENLGNLSPLANHVIMGNGSQFEVVAPAAFRSKLFLVPGTNIQPYSQALANISGLAYPPPANNFISGTGSNWVSKLIPNCGPNFVVLSTGVNFICSDNNSNFSAGTFVTNNSLALSVGDAVKFYASNNLNYVGFKAAAALSTNTSWYLPLTDGTNGQFLSTNGAGVLSFISNNSGDVLGPLTSSINYPPIFSDTLGKNLSNQSVLIVDNFSGRVGISVATPTNKLEVASLANGEGVLSGSSFLGSCNGTNFFCLSQGSVKNKTNSYALGQNDLGETSLNTNSGYSILFKIAGINQGGVNLRGMGIGTITPSNALEVLGAGAGVNGAILGNTYAGETGNGSSWSGITHSALKDSNVSYAILQSNDGTTLLNSAIGRSIGFRINDTNQMTLDSTGNLGIGTSTPVQMLTLSNGNLQMENQNTPKILFQSSGFDDANAGEIQFLEFDGCCGWKIRHDTTTPGSIRFYRRVGNVDTEQFKMDSSGQFWARVTTIGSLSDASLKKNVTDLSLDPASVIDRLRPVYFSWISDPESKTHIGFLAQEVARVDARLVEKNPISGKLMIKYDELLPLMIAQLKVLRKKNRELKKMLENDIKSEIAILRANNQKLRMALDD